MQGMLRRGLTVPTLKHFILSQVLDPSLPPSLLLLSPRPPQGASKNLNLMEMDKLWTINKKLIDPVCPRHTAILLAARVPLILTNGPEAPFVRVLPRHKKHPPAGMKATVFARRVWLEGADARVIKEGEEVTLMDWGNAIVQRNTMRSGGDGEGAGKEGGAKEGGGEGEGEVEAMEGVLHLEGSVKTTKLKLTWLADSDELVPLTLVELDYLITKKKVGWWDAGLPHHQEGGGVTNSISSPLSSTSRPSSPSPPFHPPLPPHPSFLIILPALLTLPFLLTLPPPSPSHPPHPPLPPHRPRPPHPPHPLPLHQLDAGDDFLAALNPLTWWEEAAVGDANMRTLDEGDDFLAALNPRTWWEEAAVGDANMRNLQRGDIVQLERKGYYICDQPLVRPHKPIVLIAIPDGRQRPPPGGAAAK
ncbi:unnamed protein product [Closterium sp. NIES-53]